ncbi:hypothetical protein Cl131_gp096 [Aphanizomenon phage vB_AphaS-CL131]|nr:hypothetical protein Cl131_gp096 [Aphanizomenon phage vB_AphaS-CL131]
MARYSKHQLRSTPLVHIHPDHKEQVDGLASELKILNFEALSIVLKAGFEAIENRTVDLKRIQEEIAA